MMKERYTSPEAELLRFAPAEDLATEGISNIDTDEADLVIDISKYF